MDEQLTAIITVPNPSTTTPLPGAAQVGSESDVDKAEVGLPASSSPPTSHESAKFQPDPVTIAVDSSWAIPATRTADQRRPIGCELPPGTSAGAANAATVLLADVELSSLLTFQTAPINSAPSTPQDDAVDSAVAGAVESNGEVPSIALEAVSDDLQGSTLPGIFHTWDVLLVVALALVIGMLWFAGELVLVPIRKLRYID